MTECPATEQLLEFAGGKLSDDSQAYVEAHIDGCSICRASLSALAKSPSELDAEVPNQSFGRYKLDRVLGSGGMGIVYLAQDPQLGRKLAIKVVRHVGHDAALRQRLVNEAQALAKLSHPNVCHVYDVGIEGEEVWVAMEFIDGITLRQWAATPRPREEMLEVLLGTAEGISAAHAAGLIHRDIKPENVLVTSSGRPIVMDFGLARVDMPVDPNASTMSGNPVLTATGAIVGTPAYLAPEQLTGETLDARVDQFAWATMAWELLTGVRPFPIIAAIRLDAIRAGLTPPPSLPKPIAIALTRAMQLSPRDRFESMRELIDALRAKPAPERAGMGRAPFVIGAAAVLGVTATLVGWKVLGRDEQTPVAQPVVTMKTPDAPAPAPQDAAVVVTPQPIEPKPEPVKTVAKTTEKTTEKAPAKPDVKATRVAVAPPVAPTAGSGAGSSAGSAKPLPPLKNPKFSVVRSYATMMTFCKVPIDPKNPDPALGKSGVIDWGKITRTETVIAKLVDREMYMRLYEVRGQRETYKFKDDFGALGSFDYPANQMVAVCVDPGRTEKSDIYTLPAQWTGGLDLMIAAFPITAPPIVDQMKSLAPLHVEEMKFKVSADKGKLQMKSAAHYLTRTKVEAQDGSRWDMGGWWLEVPSGIKGANLVGAGKRLWFVIEAPAFEAQPEGTSKMVAKAAMVFDEIFPQ